MDSRIAIRRFALLLAGGCLACVLAGVLAFTMQPRVFSNRRDAIAYALDQRGIKYQAIYIDHSWPDTVNNLTYGANLRIVIPNRSEIPGRIECRSGERDCYINVERLQLDRVTIPDLSAPRKIPLLEWLEGRYAAVTSGRLPWR